MEQREDLTVLINRCRSNDRKAQLKLYNDYALAMYRTAYRFLKREDLAQDAMQEGFIKAFKNLDAFNHNATFGSWLKKIVINVSLDMLKQTKVKTLELDTLEPYPEAEDDWAIDGDYTAGAIIRKMEELPLKYQTVLKLYLLEGYDHQEISRILNIPEGTSRSQLMRGKQKLKELLTKKHHENRYTGTS